MLFCLPAFAEPEIEIFQGWEVASHQVLLKSQGGSALLPDLQQARDIDFFRAIGDGEVVLIHSRSMDTATLMTELSSDPGLIYVEPNYVLRASAVPNDPRFGELWGMRNTGQAIQGVAGTPGADISAVPAWDVSTGSRSNVIGVVDTGVDYNHSDLAANVWSAPAIFTVNIGGVPVICPAGSHGFNAILKTCNPLDDNMHGSHVSGTIGAIGNNNQGVVGVNWTASIMGLKFLSAAGVGLTSDAIDAIEFGIQAKAAFAVTNGANVRVLSNSWGGGGFSQALADEISRANQNNVLFVAAAGNDGANIDSSPTYPASYELPNIVAVAATDNNDSLASFSNYGAAHVHLGAPGVNVLSTIIAHYAYLSGTSMATPHVSGAALLVLSKCALDTAGLKSNLLNNVDLIPSMAGITVTGGRLDVNKAIRACAPP
jgi:subtilisin family serine protease